ncbi:hypothetical protein EZH22_24490 [Xanthobacter dioxanivorans]|uniref:Uncharacterized protein n=1 Tax=Xanthobacter dioxanivorans TaxID=2528964 RepID=A0A974SI66_9HYPH|nr:hypothetical protein [Xanthobacter dioxanivorans]QRG06112.1 hypothetical protein EZH22_24490 [Xanthobacter dioxanivorans]
MSAEAAFVNFIRPMMVAFKDPPSGDPEAFFQALSEDLASFSQYQLEAGARHIRRERTTRTFPTVAECIAACARWPAVEPVRTEVPAAVGSADVDDVASWHRKRQAFAMMRQSYDLSRQASKEGWLGQLFDYAMERGMLPPPEASGRLCAQAEGVRSQLAAVQGGLGLSLIEAYRTRYKSIQDGVFSDERAA